MPNHVLDPEHCRLQGRLGLIPQSISVLVYDLLVAEIVNE